MPLSTLWVWSQCLILNRTKFLLASNQVRDIHTYVHMNTRAYMHAKTFKWLASICTQYRSLFLFDFCYFLKAAMILFALLRFDSKKIFFFWFCFFPKFIFAKWCILLKPEKKNTTNMKSLRLHIIPISIFSLLVPKTDLNSFFIVLKKQKKSFFLFYKTLVHIIVYGWCWWHATIFMRKFQQKTEKCQKD